MWLLLAQVNKLKSTKTFVVRVIDRNTYESKSKISRPVLLTSSVFILFENLAARILVITLRAYGTEDNFLNRERLSHNLKKVCPVFRMQ